MRLIKRKSKQTYTSKKTGKERHFYNYFVELDTGARIQIKAVFEDDVRLLSAMCSYEG